jgi:hypothetical protein
MRRLAWIAPALVLGLTACGSMSDEERFSLTTPGTDDLVVREVEGSAKPRPRTPLPSEVRVIRGWADALRSGHVNQAAAYFAIPATVLDGTNPLRQLPSRSAVRDFNRGLPCGARLLETERGQRSYVIATFRLTERPGRGSCDSGTGALARTAFLIRDRRIVQWVRVPDPPPASAPDDTVS